jgi:hypothetical protein
MFTLVSYVPKAPWSTQVSGRGRGAFPYSRVCYIRDLESCDIRKGFRVVKNESEYRSFTAPCAATAWLNFLSSGGIDVWGAGCRERSMLAPH